MPSTRSQFRTKVTKNVSDDIDEQNAFRAMFPSRCKNRSNCESDSNSRNAFGVVSGKDLTHSRMLVSR